MDHFDLSQAFTTSIQTLGARHFPPTLVRLYPGPGRRARGCLHLQLDWNCAGVTSHYYCYYHPRIIRPIQSNPDLETCCWSRIPTLVLSYITQHSTAQRMYGVASRVAHHYTGLGPYFSAVHLQQPAAATNTRLTKRILRLPASQPLILY